MYVDNRRWNGREWVEPQKKLYWNKQGVMLEMDDADAVQFGFNPEDGLGPSRGIINGLLATIILGTVAFCWYVFF